jgi:soluble lytic murein transglycosylase-like protein
VKPHSHKALKLNHLKPVALNKDVEMLRLILVALSLLWAGATFAQETAHEFIMRESMKKYEVSFTKTTSKYASDMPRKTAGLSPRFIKAVAYVESGGRCSARGAAGELGMFQIKPATARMIGYTGEISALNTCGAGVIWGIRHLEHAWRRCPSVGGAAKLHNAGLGASCAYSAYSHRVIAAYNRL